MPPCTTSAKRSASVAGVSALAAAATPAASVPVINQLGTAFELPAPLPLTAATSPVSGPNVWATLPSGSSSSSFEPSPTNRA